MKRKIISIPPTYFYLAVIFIVISYFVFPTLNLIKTPYNYLGYVLIILGIYLVFLSWSFFKKNNTPENFSRSTTLILKGPYKFSRNPMYLGMILILVGLAMIMKNLLAFIFPILFFLIIHNMFIPFEEEKNELTFKQKYLDYKKKVRKWL